MSSSAKERKVTGTYAGENGNSNPGRDPEGLRGRSQDTIGEWEGVGSCPFLEVRVSLSTAAVHLRSRERECVHNEKKRKGSLGQRVDSA